MQILHVVRVLAKNNQTVPAAGLFSRQDIEAHLAGLFADGWRLLPGFPQFTGMEGFQNGDVSVPEAGFRLLYVLTKGG